MTGIRSEELKSYSSKNPYGNKTEERNKLSN